MIFTTTSESTVEVFQRAPVNLTLTSAQVSVDDWYSSSESEDNCRKV